MYVIPQTAEKILTEHYLFQLGNFLLAEELLRGPPSFYTLQTLFTLLHSVPEERNGGQEASESALFPPSCLFSRSLANLIPMLLLDGLAFRLP